MPVAGGSNLVRLPLGGSSQLCTFKGSGAAEGCGFMEFPPFPNLLRALTETYCTLTGTLSASITEMLIRFPFPVCQCGNYICCVSDAETSLAATPQLTPLVNAPHAIERDRLTCRWAFGLCSGAWLVPLVHNLSTPGLGAAPTSRDELKYPLFQVSRKKSLHKIPIILPLNAS